MKTPTVKWAKADPRAYTIRDRYVTRVEDTTTEDGRRVERTVLVYTTDAGVTRVHGDGDGPEVMRGRIVNFRGQAFRVSETAIERQSMGMGIPLRVSEAMAGYEVFRVELRAFVEPERRFNPYTAPLGQWSGQRLRRVADGHA